MMDRWLFADVDTMRLQMLTERTNIVYNHAKMLSILARLEVIFRQQVKLVPIVTQ